jgi:archaellum component FlaC
VQSISSDIRELSDKLNPLINSANKLTEKLIHVTNEVQSQLQISETIIFDIRDRVDMILNVEAKIRNGLEDAAMPLINNLKAIGNGVETFWRKYTNR